jgi:ubiquinone/menaquinone biosynthesis C-methylase UbiE
MTQTHSSKTQPLKDTISEYYNSIASGYDTLYEEEQLTKLRAIANELLTRNITPSRRTKLLDIGCGSGISSDFFAKNYGAQIIGIDPAEKLIQINKNNLCEFIIGHAESLPFPNQTFDMILSLSAIQNFTDRNVAYSEMKRVAKPDAIFILTFMAKQNPHADTILSELTYEFHLISKITAKNDIVLICKV